MDEIKSYLLEFIWSGKDVSDFEQWLYHQNSIEFEGLIEEENYIELISFDYVRKTVEQVKQFIRSVLPETLVKEFESEFEKRKSRAIRGTCIKEVALDYYARENRNWDVEIGRQYEFLIINLGIKDGNHLGLVKYVDRANYFQPSGFVPMELFDIDLANISEFYHRVTESSRESTTELKAFSKEYYKPVRYSFWEDFYDDEDKAVTTYFDIIEKLGIKNVW